MSLFCAFNLSIYTSSQCRAVLLTFLLAFHLSGRSPAAEAYEETSKCWSGVVRLEAIVVPTVQKSPVTASSWADLQNLFLVPTPPVTISIESARLVATRPLVIRSPGVTITGGAGGVIIDCNGAQSAFILKGVASARLDGLIFTNCSGSAVVVSGPAGGTIRGGGTDPSRMVVISNCAFRSNRGVRGAALSINSSTVLMDGVELSSNSALAAGGAVYAQQSLVVMQHCNATGNTAGRGPGTAAAGTSVSTSDDDPARGGVMYALASRLMVLASNFTGNSAMRGGALALDRPVGLTQIQRSSFADNRVTDKAGGLLLTGGGAAAPATCAAAAGGAAIDDTAFVGNIVVKGDGGAIHATYGVLLLLRGSRFDRNAATGGDLPNGGGVYTVSARMHVDNCTFTNNSALEGGCVTLYEGSRATFVRTSFRACNAGAHGGALYMYQARADMADCQVRDCTSTVYGGGAFLGLGANITLQRVVIANSSAGPEAGGIYCIKPTGMEGTPVLNLVDSIVEGNQANYGGAISINDCITRMTNTSLNYNIGRKDGGALYVYATGTGIPPATVTLSSTRWIGNSAAGRAGALYLSAGSADLLTMTATDMLFQGNTAGADGGAVLLSGAMLLTLMRSRFVNNSAGTNGGSLSVEGPDAALLLTACSLSGSRAEEGGGALFIGDGVTDAALEGCELSRNTAGASGGAVLVGAGGRVALRGCVVANNACPSGIGGAVSALEDAQVVAADGTRLEGNKASFGGSIGLFGSTAMLSSVAILGNSAVAGGALAAFSGSVVNCSTGCNFTDNHALLGGAIATYTSVVRISGGKFTANHATAAAGTSAMFMTSKPAGRGGAMYLWATTSTLDGCVVEGNEASDAGGGLFVDAGSLASAKMELLRNTARSAGGGLACAGANTGCKLVGGSVDGNTAAQGGGVWVGPLEALGGDGGSLVALGDADELLHSSPGASLQGLAFATNSAHYGDGGALRCERCVRLDVARCSFASNSAPRGSGGGVSCGLCGSVWLSDTTFTSNSAASGGALALLTPRSPSQLQDVLFYDNRAAVPGPPHGDGPKLPPPGAAPLGGHAPLPASSLNLPTCGAPGTGGAICVAASAPLRLLGSVTFDSNHAGHGGALFVEACSGDSARACPLQLSPSTVSLRNPLGSRSPPVYATDANVLQRLSLCRNGSSSGGGSCGGAPATPRRRRLHAPGAGDDNASAAAAAGGGAARGTPAQFAWLLALGGAGSDPLLPVTTNPRYLDLRIDDTSTSGADGTLRILTEAAESLPLVQVSVRDQLNGPAQSSVAELVTVQAQADCLSIDEGLGGGGGAGNAKAGDVSVRLGPTGAAAAAEGCIRGMVQSSPSSNSSSVTFDSLQVWAKPGHTYEVTFAATGAGGTGVSQSAPLQVALADCVPGEIRTAVGCVKCAHPYYSFDRDAPSCSVCPTDAQNCSATLLLPLPTGYWQSSARSATLHRCPQPLACLRTPAATTSMVEQQEATAAMLGNMSFSDYQAAVLFGAPAYQELQCAPEYSGTLCASCAKPKLGPDGEWTKYGGFLFRCQACYSMAITLLFWLLSKLLDLAIIAVLIYCEAKDRTANVKALAVAEAEVQHKLKAQKSRFDPKRDVGTSGGSRPYSRSVAAKESKERQLFKDAARPLFCKDASPRLMALGAIPEISSQAINQTLVEFMQLLSILRSASVNAYWDPTMLAALGAVAPFTPATTASWISPDCLWPVAWSAGDAVYYACIITTIVTPFAYALVVSAVWVGYVLFRSTKESCAPQWREYKPHFVLCMLVVVSYCYPSLANAMLSIFSCRDVDSGAMVPGEVQATVGRYWNTSLNIKCWEGWHRTFVLAVGVPGMLLVLAYPAAMAGLLMQYGKRQKLYGNRFWANYGYFWQDYRPRLYWWRAVIEMRKLAFVAVVVVLGSHSSAAQLLGAWAVALTMLLSHMGLSPMHHQRVGRLQTASLGGITVAVFVNMCIAYLPLNSTSSLALQAVVVVMALCIVVYIAYNMLGYYFFRFGGIRGILSSAKGGLVACRHKLLQLLGREAPGDEGASKADQAAAEEQPHGADESRQDCGV